MLTIRFQDGQKIQTFDCVSDYLLERRCSKVISLLNDIDMHPETRSEICEMVKRVINGANVCHHETIDTLKLHMTARIAGETQSTTDFERVIDLVQEISSRIPVHAPEFMAELTRTVCNIYYHTKHGNFKQSFIHQNHESIDKMSNTRMFVFNVPTRKSKSEFEIRYHVVVDLETNYYGISVNRGYNLLRTETVQNLFTAFARARKYKNKFPIKLSVDCNKALLEIIKFINY
uniref:Uncharacterized protein n=1 Tax=viral metagenome TaxID=1070528 RepID=A0A6C0CJL9_9ZZZZ